MSDLPSNNNEVIRLQQPHEVRSIVRRDCEDFNVVYMVVTNLNRPQRACQTSIDHVRHESIVCSDVKVLSRRSCFELYIDRWRAYTTHGSHITEEAQVDDVISWLKV